MTSHRVIWLVTGAFVLVAALVLVVREAGELPTNNPPVTGNASGLLLYEKALAEMMTALTVDPHMDLSETRSSVSNVAELARGLIPIPAEGLYALGLSFMEQQRLPEAESALRQAISQKPSWSWPYNALGILLANHSEGRTQEAEVCFRKAIELDPSWSRPHNDLAILLRLSDRMEEAEKEAREAIRLSPSSVAAYNNYGNLLVVLRRLNEAEPQYLKAIEIDPRHPKPFYNLACLFCLQGRTDEALEYLRKAFENAELKGVTEGLRQEALKDLDLTPLKNDARFREIVEGSHALQR